MTKEKWEDEYCKVYNITHKEYFKNFETLKCNCGGYNCKGWICVNKNQLSINTHNILYGKEVLV